MGLLSVSWIITSRLTAVSQVKSILHHTNTTYRTLPCQRNKNQMWQSLTYNRAPTPTMLNSASSNPVRRNMLFKHMSSWYFWMVQTISTHLTNSLLWGMNSYWPRSESRTCGQHQSPCITTTNTNKYDIKPLPVVTNQHNKTIYKDTHQMARLHQDGNYY